MSVLAETEGAVVAPAFSHRRWNVGRGIFSPLRGSAIVPVMTTVLPASGASAATSGGRSSARTSTDTPRERTRPGPPPAPPPPEPRRRPPEVLLERGRDLRADVLDGLERLRARPGHLLQRL